MKTKGLKMILAVIFVALAGYGVFASQQKPDNLSDVMLENVEALADNELPEVEVTCSRTCSDGVGRCYYVYDRWGNCHFNGDQSCYCTC